MSPKALIIWHYGYKKAEYFILSGLYLEFFLYLFSRLSPTCILKLGLIHIEKEEVKLSLFSGDSLIYRKSEGNYQEKLE